MFYWFKRGNEFMRYEARTALTGRFEFTVVAPDGTEHVEQFDNADALQARQVAFEKEIGAEGWTGPHGWNL